MKYFEITELLKGYKSQFYIVIGQRSNGKSYSTLKYVIDDFINNGNEFMYIRRFEDNIKSKYMNSVFSDLEPYLLETYGMILRFYNGAWYLGNEDSETINDMVIMGRCSAINCSEKLKSTNYPNTTTIIFEEFIATLGYLSDEVNLLMNMISTIFRNRVENHKVIMIGNTIAKDNPYFDSLGIRLSDVRKGESKTIESNYNGVNTRVTIHRCKDNNSKKIVNKVGFTSFGVTNFGTMIHDGEIETRQGMRFIDGYYPHKIKGLNHTKKDKFININDNFYGAYLKYGEELFKIYALKIKGNKYISIEKANKDVNRSNIRYLITNDRNEKALRLILDMNNLPSSVDEVGNEVINVPLLHIYTATIQNNIISPNNEIHEDFLRGMENVGLIQER